MKRIKVIFKDGDSITTENPIEISRGLYKIQTDVYVTGYKHILVLVMLFVLKN